MFIYSCNQCESAVENISLEGTETYICPICSEVPFGKIHKKIAPGQIPSFSSRTLNKNNSIEVGDSFRLENMDFIKVIEKNRDSIEFEEDDGTVTLMSIEEFGSLISEESFNGGPPRKADIGDSMEIASELHSNQNSEKNSDQSYTDLLKVASEDHIEEIDEEDFSSNRVDPETIQGFAFDSLESVRKKLIDLTNRNSLLNYRHPKGSSIRIIDELPDQIVEVLSEGKSFTFIPVPEPTEAELIREGFIKIDPSTRAKKYLEHPTAEEWARRKGLSTSYDLPGRGDRENGEERHRDTKLQTPMYASQLESRCRSIRGKAETAIEESGANILYLILGFLEWRESRDSNVVRQAPLFTLPVRMERKKFERGEGTFRYIITLKDDGLLTNIPLREKLANDFGLILPELTDEETPEDYFVKVSRTILKHQPEWKLRRQATLALLNFSKQVMYEDLNPERWPTSSAIENHPIIKQFFSSAGIEYCQSDIGYSTEHEIDKIKDVHELFPLVYEADSSQHSALIDAVEGKNLVIEGPPGSGKSQTITNLIAASIANGKKVLFVAEKMAALDVVKNRLDRVDLGDFCLELHSHKTQKNKILGDLACRLNKQDDYRYPGKIDVDIARYEDLKIKLQRYVEIINQPWKKTGLTIHEILNRATRYREELGINPEHHSIVGINGDIFTPAKQKELLDQTEFLAGVYDQVAVQSPTGKVSGHYWSGCNCLKMFGYETEELHKLLEEWTRHLSDLAAMWTNHVSNFQLGCNANVPVDVVALHINDLEQLPSLVGGEPLSCIPALLNSSEPLTAFLDSYDEIHISNEKLADLIDIKAIDDPLEFNKIRVLTDILSNWQVSETASLAGLQLALSQASRFIELAEVVDAGFSKIREQVPGPLQAILTTSLSGLREFQILVSLIEQLPSDLWRSRDLLYDDNDIDPLLEKLTAHLHVLTPLHTRLLEVFSLHRIPDHIALAETWTQYKTGGFFRLLSPKWRHAKKEILSLAASRKTNKKEIVALIPDLLKYIEGVNSINELNKETSILGDLFLGVETPLDRIMVVRSWYKKVRKEYGRGFGDRAVIGDSLLTMDRNIAASILDYAKQELFELIKQLNDGMATFQKGFPGNNSFSNKSILLVGENSSLNQFSQTLNDPFSSVLRIVKKSVVSLNDLIALHNETNSLHVKNQEWSSDPLRAQLSEFGYHLSSSPKEFSSQLLKQGRNLTKILSAINASSTLTASFWAQPDVERYESLRAQLPELQHVFLGTESTRESFYRRGEVCEADWIESSSGEIIPLIEKNKSALAKREWLATWVDYIKVKKRLTSEGLKEILEPLESGKFTSDKLLHILLLCINHQLAKEIFAENQYLTDFSGLEQNEIRKKFREYDCRLQKLQQEKISFRASRVRLPAGVSTGRVSTYTEMGLIRQEMGKRKRHIAVRSLMKRAGNAIQSLKPCFMMSPMSVAQYLEPGNFEFDLVVMDEASQIKPEDALGAVARGKSFVVVGDPKQLPPTSFFQKIIDVENDEDVVALEESESILESVTPMFKNRRLRWHYRSRHESLIAFSNHHFYNSNLILFPSPFQTSNELGIRYVRLKKARFRNRRNIEEAKAIVEQISRQMINYPDDSLGVVAMNSEQRDEIEQQLDQQLKDNDLFRIAMDKNKGTEEPLFIKNLENVQGDERDVIFISMTYGPDQIGGRLMQRFGPINSDVGWRRLNVLFTRSKKRMRIFSSMGSDDILVKASSSRGVKALRAFLEYCETGHLHHSAPTGKEADSDFEIAVMNALTNHGYECEPQLGVAGFFLDLAVRDPGQAGRFLMGIECDGATYHSAKSSRDRDRLRQDILENLGWNISRIWSTDWFKNPEACLRPILQELDGLKTISSSKEDTSSEDVFEDVAEVEETFDQNTLTLEDGSVSLPQLTLRDRLIDFRSEVIDIEQPDVAPDKRLLRDAMIESLLRHQPCSKGEFHEFIPGHLRSGTAVSQGRYIDSVCELISDYGV